MFCGASELNHVQASRVKGTTGLRKRALGWNYLSLLQVVQEMATAEGIKNKNGTRLFTSSVLSKHFDNALHAARSSVLLPKIQILSPIFTRERTEPRKLKLLGKEVHVQKVQSSAREPKTTLDSSSKESNHQHEQWPFNYTSRQASKGG